MDEILKAAQTLLRGYDNELSMYDDDMIDAAEVICGQYINLIPDLIEAHELLARILECSDTNDVESLTVDLEQARKLLNK